MPIFVPTSSVYPASTANEVTWYFLSDKTWSTQKVFLQVLPNSTDPYSSSLNSSIKINNIMTVKSDQQVITQNCLPQNYAANSSNCQYQIQANQLSILLRQNLTKFNNIVNCSMDSCNLGFYVYGGANFTVQQLLNFY